MIDFLRVWLPQIIRYAELVVEEDVLRRSWLEFNSNETSVTNPDEMIVQVFDDLDAEELVKEAPSQLEAHPELVAALQAFLDRLMDWNGDESGSWNIRPLPAITPDVFESETWRRLRQEAERLLAAAERAGFSSSDFAPAHRAP